MQRRVEKIEDTIIETHGEDEFLHDLHNSVTVSCTSNEVSSGFILKRIVDEIEP